ncbi:S-layer homology domain-containing protein [Paenibacillus taiwanensis]|uniref:S-layer homology domain-containing protein n=1 Tax=Paenibacillus taiwanensis TaxID=401638 RepID=UPI00040E9B9D|nr:S-layer homology domain-containing protein [Paenibacillus taiwanensis]
MNSRFSKVALSSILAASLVMPSVMAAPSSFKDIEHSFAKQAIQELASQGIISGVGEGKFNPKGKINRQDFAIIMAKALKLEVNVNSKGTMQFKDVPVDHYAYSYIEAVIKAGLFKGVSEHTFGLNESLTREQLASIFIRALGVDVAGKGQTLKFADQKDISSWAKDAVAYAIELKLMGGTTPDRFDPKGTATREQVAAVTSNFQLSSVGQAAIQKMNEQRQQESQRQKEETEKQRQEALKREEERKKLEDQKSVPPVSGGFSGGGGGSGTGTVTPSDEQLVTADSDALTVLLDARDKSVTAVTYDVYLPKIGKNGSTITWKSSDDSIINAMTGKVNRPWYLNGDGQLTLTAEIIKGSAKISKSFHVTVLKYPPTAGDIISEKSMLYRDEGMLQLEFHPGDASNDVTERIRLYSSINEMIPNIGISSTITWSSSDETVISSKGEVFRAIGTEHKDVTLTAKLTLINQSVEKQFHLKVKPLRAHNQVPTIVKQLPDITIGEGNSWIPNIQQYFSDPDGDRLTYDLKVENTDIFEPNLVKHNEGFFVLSTYNKKPGTTKVTIIAKDRQGGASEQSFKATLIAGIKPVPGKELSTLTMSVGQAVYMDVRDYFTDPNQEITNLQVTIIAFDNRIVEWSYKDFLVGIKLMEEPVIGRHQIILSVYGPVSRCTQIINLELPKP